VIELKNFGVMVCEGFESGFSLLKRTLEYPPSP